MINNLTYEWKRPGESIQALGKKERVLYCVETPQVHILLTDDNDSTFVFVGVHVVGSRKQRD